MIKKTIESLLKEEDEKNRFLISGPYKEKCKTELTVIVSKIKDLKKKKRK